MGKETSNVINKLPTKYGEAYAIQVVRKALMDIDSKTFDVVIGEVLVPYDDKDLNYSVAVEITPKQQSYLEEPFRVVNHTMRVELELRDSEFVIIGGEGGDMIGTLEASTLYRLLYWVLVIEER